jgi:Txe/YoeB family toxin of Txe-Axe toxin-antitoxin module
MRTKTYKDNKIKSPYKNYSNHELIEILFTQHRIRLCVKQDKDSPYFKEDYEYWCSKEKNIRYREDIKQRINKLKKEIKSQPIPPIAPSPAHPNIKEDIDWHQLKQFYVGNAITGEKLNNAFVALYKIEDEHRLIYSVICDRFDKERNIYHLTIKFHSCFGHYVDDIRYSDISDEGGD